MLTEKKDKFIRFNAAQSVVVFGGLMLIFFIPFLGPLVAFFLWPLSLVLWIVLMVKAYNNQKMKLPYVSDWAKEVEKKIKPQ
ncbi:MAG: hypothetical protein U9O78_02175 [Patescibacteria group bacterium]|nr:hypothetical protein [Patescibacteria group bacterium]